MSYSSGSAIATYILDASQAKREIAEFRALAVAAAEELRKLFDGVQQQAPLGKGSGGAGGGSPQFGPTQQNTSQVIAYANAQAHLAQVQNTGKNALAGLTQAEQIYQDALTKVNANSIEAIRLQTQLAAVQNRIKSINGGGLPVLPRTLESFGTGAIEQFKSSIIGLVGPAALVTAGFAAAGKAVEFFGDAFKFKAELDQSQLAVTTLLHGVRDSAQTFDEARTFAARYKLTQQETTEAINESIPVIRNSKSSISDILSVFTRLTILKPGKTFQDASRAIAELQAGQAVSLEKIFNVPIDKANALKHEIEGGGDAIQVLNRFLTESGVGMSALETRTRGATGALNDQRIAAEKLKLAAGGASGGPGLAITKASTAVQSQAADILGGQGQTIASQKFGELAKLFGVSEEKAKSFGIGLAQLGGYTNSAAESAQLAAGIFDEERSAIGRAQIASEAAKDVEDRRARALNELRNALNAANEDATKFVAGTHEAADASALDAAKKDVQSAATNRVSFETKSAADAFLRLNPNLDASQAFAAAAAAGLGPLVAEVIRLRVEADKTRGALLGEKLNAQSASALTGSNSEEAQLRARNRAILDDARSTSIASGRAADEAQRQADAAAGNLTPALTRAQTELNQLAKDGKQNTTEYIQKQQAITDLQQKQTAQGKKALDDQIAYAKATGATAKARQLLNQQLAAAKTRGDVGEQARILEELKSLDKTRISAAQSTALQLQNVEENSQLQLAKTQREGLERLRDQEADFTLHRVRSKEDEDRKIRGLLARGQRAQAAREREDFTIQQRRDQEDFTIQRQRTLRNNAESTGDIDKRADLRQEQIGNRAALRGVRTNGGATLGGGGSAPATLGDTSAASAAAGGATTIQINVQANTNLDGQKVGELIFEVIRQRLDDNFALELRSAPPPGAAQGPVSGARP